MESISNRSEQTSKDSGAAAVGGTVMELMAVLSEQPNMHRMGAPDTPPFDMDTTTRSGEGYAQIADDSISDHMYE